MAVAFEDAKGERPSRQLGGLIEFACCPIT
jgi:hypothetical protein